MTAAVGMYLVASGLAIGAGWLAHWLMHRAATRDTVFRNLDDAYENGHFGEGEYLWQEGPYEVAYDLTCYAADCEGKNPDSLAPYVHEWMKQKGIRW